MKIRPRLARRKGQNVSAGPNRRPADGVQRINTPSTIHGLKRALGNREMLGLIQAKLRIGPPDDEYEQEADRIADQVVRMSDAEVAKQADEETQAHTLCSRSIVNHTPRSFQRIVEPADEEKEDEEVVQPKSHEVPPHRLSRHDEAHIRSLEGSGRELAQSDKAFFEPRFGHDLSQVRLHTDGSANHVARQLDATAFTIGRNIFFAKGRYDPITTRGRRLIAHELTHVLQQESGSAVRRQEELTPTKHKVTKGDTLFMLGKRYGVTVAELEAANPGVEARRLQIGSELKIPAPRKSRSSKELPSEEAGRTREKEGAEKPTEKKEDLFTYHSRLNAELKARFNDMVHELRSREIGYGDINDYREPRTAHRWSTAHHIYNDEVPIENLRALLPSGRDSDGTRWYTEEWDRAIREGGFMERLNAIGQLKLNAATNAREIYTPPKFLRGGRVTYAEEGYGPRDPRRLPNIGTVPLSRHVSGDAIDLSRIEWDKFDGGAWGKEAKAFVNSFGLTRPFYPGNPEGKEAEPWHFELAK